MPSTNPKHYSPAGRNLWVCDHHYYLFIKINKRGRPSTHTVEGFLSAAEADAFRRGMNTTYDLIGGDPTVDIVYLTPEQYMRQPLEKEAVA